MNYPLRDIIIDFFARDVIRAAEFDARLAKLRMQYREQVNAVLYNLVGSHDTTRFLSLCNGQVQRMKLALIFQMTYIGMPAIYYGDEIGLMGSKKWEDCRRGMIWDEKKQDLDLLDFCRRLIKVRKNRVTLARGDFATLHADSKTNVYAYLRTREKDQLLIALNNSPRRRNVTFKGTRLVQREETLLTDLLTGKEFEMSAGNIHLSLKPYTGVILSERA
jgi:cyclomaltodextrinase